MSSLLLAKNPPDRVNCTYVIDVDPDGESLDAVDGDVILEILAEDRAGDHVVQNHLKKFKHITENKNKIFGDSFFYGCRKAEFKNRLRRQKYIHSVAMHVWYL
jgi:hypothetical protein